MNLDDDVGQRAERSEGRQVETSPSGEFAEAFHRDGYVLVPHVFERTELQELAEHLFHLRQPAAAELARYRANPFDFGGKAALDQMTPEELQRSERLLRLHLFDGPTRQLMLDPRLFAIVRPLWPGEPLATHALYFPKPPGARGIALHPEVGYVPVDPPELVGCFIAVDDADPENGALSVVRGSHRLSCVTRHPVDPEEFISQEEFDQPPGTELVVVTMQAGDVLMFDGRTLHGSLRNRTTDRWRRAFLCHYISAAVRSVHEHFSPVFRSTGEEVRIPVQVESPRR